MSCKRATISALLLPLRIWRTLIKSKIIYLFFYFIFILCWAFAVHVALTAHCMRHHPELELLFCLCTFEPWRERKRRRIDDGIIRSELLLNCCTGAKLHAHSYLCVPPAGQPCHFVVLRGSSLWCHHQLKSRETHMQSRWKCLRGIKRILKNYNTASLLIIFRAWEHPAQ